MQRILSKFAPMMTDSEKNKLAKLRELVKPFQALLFDVDGTLADNMHAHKAAYVATAREYGIDLDAHLIDETAGWPTISVPEEISKRYNPPLAALLFAARKSTIFIERHIQPTKPIPF